jgi:hypothetical protein
MLAGVGRGSFTFGDPDQPVWDHGTALEREYEYQRADGTYSLSVFKGRRQDRQKVFLKGRRFFGSQNDLQIELQESPRDFYRLPGLEYVRKGSGGEPDLLYMLPELRNDMAERPDEVVFITEGEKDTETLRGLGLIATTNPNGALHWNTAFNAEFMGREIVVLTDNDENGRLRGERVIRELRAVANSVRVVELPDLPEGGDVTDWLEAGRTKEDLLEAIGSAEVGVRLTDFYAFMPAHAYIFAPTGQCWPSSSVNSRISPVDVGSERLMPANRWLDRHRPVEQMTWAPGDPQFIVGRLILQGGWVDHPGCNTFNLYHPPKAIDGTAAHAGPWLEHIDATYPAEAEHLLNWLAHRVQKPNEKINHALVLGGAQGIGKDTILEPVKRAVGAWNFAEVSPHNLLGRFNGFLKSVVLRVNEARDLGDVDRFAFYDHTKMFTAAPPDVLRIDEKNLREYYIPNLCGVIITTNHKSDGLYLPEDDRRHFVAWSERTKDDFTPEYWQRLWGWYDQGGLEHVAAFLATRDITGFDAKAPPPKTEAFFDIVAANTAPEAAELTDALEKLGWPRAVTLSAVAEAAEADFSQWLRDRRNSKRVGHKMEECGYRPVRNPGAAKSGGRWKVNRKDVVIYARRELALRDAITAAEKLAQEGENVPL